MEYPVNYIVNELKIINLVLELVPIDSKLKKNLNISAIALTLKPRLFKIAHDIVANDLKEKNPSKPEWQPKFKVGDWVIYKNPSSILLKIKSIDFKNENYRTEHFDGLQAFGVTELNIKPWQPIQKLKDELAQSNEKIEEFEKTDLPKGVRAKKHRWVELSDFVNTNREWVNNNINTILTQCEFFYKKGDLDCYAYNRKLNTFLFDYAPGITKLMIPLCFDIEK